MSDASSTVRPGNESATSIPEPSALSASDLPPYYAAVLLAREAGGCTPIPMHRAPAFTLAEMTLSFAV